jgi:hypothetical protein
MVKPTTKGEAVAPSDSPTLAEIELSRIESNPWQPRTTAPTDEELGALLNSIKAVGQKMPVLVRANPKKEKFFQLGDGAMRMLVQRKLKKKTIIAMVQPLTDRQMKILAIAANTFVRLQDSDKEAAVYKLWESEFKTEEEGRPGARKDSEYTGIRDMERETGIGKDQIIRYLQSYEARKKIAAEDPRNKELKAAVEEVSTKDMAAIASVAKESPKIAQEIIKARTAESAPLRSKDVQEIVKAVKEAAPADKARVAEQIIFETRAEAKAIQEVKKATAERVEEIKADATSPEEKTKRAQKASSDRDEEDRRQELEAKQKAAIDREKLDGQQLQDFINLETAAKNWAMRTEANANETIFSRIANVRNQNVKRETISKVRAIALVMKEVAEKWAAFAAKFKE